MTQGKRPNPCRTGQSVCEERSIEEDGLIAAGEQLVSRTAHALEHHPKHVTALIAALLLGGGGAAFAVASLDPEPDRAGAPGAGVRPAAAGGRPGQRTRRARLQSVPHRGHAANDTAEALLSRLGVYDPAAAAYLRKDATFRAQLLGRAGRTVTVEADGAQALQKLSARWAPEDNGTFKRLVIERDGPGPV